MVAVYAVEESNVPDTVGDHDTVPVYCSPEMVVTGTSPNAGGVTPCIDTMTVSGDPLPPPSPPPPQAVNVSERTKRIKNEKFLLFEKMENGKWKMENLLFNFSIVCPPLSRKKIS